MAGMLPGVEAARRRRFHNSYGSDQPSPTTSVRRPSFCLYASSHDFLSNSSMCRNLVSHQGLCDESRLGAAAREAKKRLDEKLQPQWRSQTKRIECRHSNSKQRLRSLENRPTIQSNSQAEVPKLNKKGSKRLNWLKLRWKSSEQEECAVCLEPFKAKTLMDLPCGHRFHTNCLVPWLEGNAHCPCCRMAIPS